MNPPDPAVQAVLETALYVRDVRRAVEFYQRVLGLRLIDEFDELRGAAMAAGPSVLLLFLPDVARRGERLPAHGADGAGHVAFRVAAEDLPRWRKTLVERGVTIEREHAFGDNPPSIYFRDPDGNLLELAVRTVWKDLPL